MRLPSARVAVVDAVQSQQGVQRISEMSPATLTWDQRIAAGGDAGLLIEPPLAAGAAFYTVGPYLGV